MHQHYKTTCGPTECDNATYIALSDAHAASQLHAGRQKVGVTLKEDHGTYKLTLDASGIDLTCINVELIAEVTDNVGDSYDEHFTLFGAK